MSERRELVIDRSTWLRGEGDDKSCLYRPEDGRKCCLGFAGEQLCGLTTEQMRRVSAPNSSDEVLEAFRRFLPWLFDKKYTLSAGDAFVPNSAACGQLMETNDAQFEACYDFYSDPVPMPDSKREAFIVKTFAKHGIDVRFIDSAEGP